MTSAYSSCAIRSRDHTALVYCAGIEFHVKDFLLYFRRPIVASLIDLNYEKNVSTP